jgi:hypothetical protein
MSKTKTEAIQKMENKPERISLAEARDSARATIEDIILSAGKHNQEQCSEIADAILRELPSLSGGSAVWVKVSDRFPGTYKVRFKDISGNEFNGNYSKQTGLFYAYRFQEPIKDVIEWLDEAPEPKDA